jgi:ribosomal protein L11 methyltransferase
VAIDVAAAAIEATDRNSLANGVHDVVRASTTPLVELDGRFQVVLANVLAPDLIVMAADLRRVVAPGGVLVISGILAERHDHALAALLPLRPMSTATADGWAAVTLQAD